MKLKKIASLALAGVMAVSMLAGCAGKTGTTDDGTTVVVTSSNTAVDTFNDAQEQVEFTSDAALQSALNQAVKTIGTNASYTIRTPGENDWTVITTTVKAEDHVADFITGATGIVNKAFPDKAGETTMLKVVRYDSDAAWSDEAAAMLAVNNLESFKKTTYNETSTKTGDKYVDFTYNGTVAVASVSDGTGATVYFVAYTVTQNGTEKTYTGKAE